MWLEILAQTDRTEGLWKGDEQDLVSILAGACESNTRGAAKFLQWVTEVGWIVWQRGSETGHRYGLFVVNYANYHRRREPIKNLHGNQTGALLPSHPSEPPNLKDPAPAADLLKKKMEEVNREIEMILNRLAAIDGEKTKEVLRWVKSSARNEIPYPIVLSSLRKLEPKAKTADEWWPYLAKIGKQEFGRFNEAESSRFKAEERKSLGLPSASNRHAAGARG